MKKPKKSSARNKRRQKENGQARLKAEQNIRKEGSDRLSRVHEAKPCEPASPHSPAGRKPQRDDDERKRKLWERKQAELEARWVTAQSRQTDEDTARKRTMRFAWTSTATVLAVLLCALAWYFAYGGIHIDIPA
jgi:hypothetical protein